MNYKGYEIIEYDDKVVIQNVKDFNLVHTFECGQCFRWKKQKDGSFIGVVKDKTVMVRMIDNTFEIHNTNISDFIGLWFNYFDLGRDYGIIKQKLSQIDSIMKEAVDFGWGIRILKQDIWETLISFIISANNKIPRIMKIVETISSIYGKPIIARHGTYFSFPSPKDISSLSIENLTVCKAGFRCKYILKASQDILNRRVNICNLSKFDTYEARDELIKLDGVGEKVADCILLFSGIKEDVFPIDVWVKRVMEELYFKKEVGIKEIRLFAKQYFGDLAGFAQQYLFYHAREKKIGVK